MFTIEEILEATGGRLIGGSRRSRVSGVSIDSRTIKPKELFVAIRGARFDGHNFIAQAKRKCAGAIVFCDSGYEPSASAFKYSSSITMIRVKNTLRALGALAHYYRARFKIPVIAITGSNGKTTTKEMLSNILARRFNVLRSPGTQNTQIGISLAILSLRKRHNLAVLEIGSNHTGEIDRLSWIIRPTVGIITNIGPSHLEFFKSLKGVFNAKLELIKNLAKNAKLIINKDDPFLSRLNGTNLRTVTFGFSRFSNFCGQVIEQTKNKTIFLLNRRHRIMLKVLGRHNVYNALASVACARDFGISYDEIKDALVSFQALPMRMQTQNINSIKIIKDCYNANPQSFGCALDFLREYSSRGRKIVVCGDMLELGRWSEKFHINSGKRIAKDEIDFLITVGHLAKNIALGAHLAGMPKESIRTFCNTFEAAKFLRGLASAGDIILVKGSRGMKMENVVECFTSFFIH